MRTLRGPSEQPEHERLGEKIYPLLAELARGEGISVTELLEEQNWTSVLYNSERALSSDGGWNDDEEHDDGEVPLTVSDAATVPGVLEYCRERQRRTNAQEIYSADSQGHAPELAEALSGDIKDGIQKEIFRKLWKRPGAKA